MRRRRFSPPTFFKGEVGRGVPLRKWAGGAETTATPPPGPRSRSTPLPTSPLPGGRRERRYPTPRRSDSSPLSRGEDRRKVRRRRFSPPTFFRGEVWWGVPLRKCGGVAETTATPPPGPRSRSPPSRPPPFQVGGEKGGIRRPDPPTPPTCPGGRFGGVPLRKCAGGAETTATPRPDREAGQPPSRPPPFQVGGEKGGIRRPDALIPPPCPGEKTEGRCAAAVSLLPPSSGGRRERRYPTPRRSDSSPLSRGEDRRKVRRRRFSPPTFFRGEVWWGVPLRKCAGGAETTAPARPFVRQRLLPLTTFSNDALSAARQGPTPGRRKARRRSGLADTRARRCHPCGCGNR